MGTPTDSELDQVVETSRTLRLHLLGALEHPLRQPKNTSLAYFSEEFAGAHPVEFEDDLLEGYVSRLRNSPKRMTKLIPENLRREVGAVAVVAASNTEALKKSIAGAHISDAVEGEMDNALFRLQEEAGCDLPLATTVALLPPERIAAYAKEFEGKGGPDVSMAPSVGIKPSAPRI